MAVGARGDKGSGGEIGLEGKFGRVVQDVNGNLDKRHEKEYRGDMTKLTAKQQMFVKEYLIDLNATQAAIKAGYSPRTAEVIGYENLNKPQIAAAIQDAMDKRCARLEITADRVLQEIAKLAFSNPQDYYHTNGAPKEINELTREQAAAIHTIKTNMTDECAVLEIKLHDKGQNLERLGKHLKLFTDKTELTGKDGEALTIQVVKFGDSHTP